MFHDVLIVDDDADIRFYLSLVLDSEGFRCLEAQNGQEALELLMGLKPQEYPSMAIVDVMMPILDGAGFIRELEKRQFVQSFPIYLCTSALVAPEVNYYGKRCPVYSKPYDIDGLIDLIRKFRRDPLVPAMARL